MGAEGSEQLERAETSFKKAEKKTKRTDKGEGYDHVCKKSEKDQKREEHLSKAACRLFECGTSIGVQMGKGDLGAFAFQSAPYGDVF